MLSGHRLKADRSPEQRSAVTNRNALFLENIDERSAFARRFRDVLSLHISDLGGWEAVSEAQASIARRAATITVQLEQIECRFAQVAEPNDKLADLYSRLSNTLRRLLESIGFERKARDITPDLDLRTYIAAQNAARDKAQ
jgi:hypothetical protein